jgi:prepilin-type N-terminal cleavage/methylation domain-containing protein
MDGFLAMGSNHSTTSRKSTAGFTLVEVIVALLILSTGILGLVRFQGTILANSSFSREHSEAVLIAQRKVEELRSYAALAPSAGSLAYADVIDGADTLPGKTGDYQRVWSVTDSAGPDYKQLNTDVTWTDVQGNDQTVSVTTEIGRIHPALTAVAILPPRPVPAGLPAR